MLTPSRLAELSSRGPASEFAPLTSDQVVRELQTIREDRTPIRTTPVGKLLVRNVCMMFDRYLQDGARFSSTI